MGPLFFRLELKKLIMIIIMGQIGIKKNNYKRKEGYEIIRIMFGI